MKLQQRSAWRTYAEDKATGEKCEFLLRQIPPGVFERIFRETYGDQYEVRRKKGETIERVNFGDQRAQRVKTACYALEDSRGYEHLIASPEQAKVIGAALGSGPALEVGGYAVLDGHWSDEVKQLVVNDTAFLINFVNEELGKLNVDPVTEGKD